MSNKIALNFICKNEAHVIERMLDSIKDITDLVVCNDTGSTDGTQDVIKKWGEKNNIPTYVFERPFDNFENSRNHAKDKLSDVVGELKLDADKVYGYWIDCDETMIVKPTFNKDKLNKDLYMIYAFIGKMKYTRNTFFRVSKKSLKWYGPIHEFINVFEPTNTTSDILTDVIVDVKMDGDSWKENVPEKYRKHSVVFEDYINNVNREARWVFYTAQSFHDSASMPDNKAENDERLRRAMKYYKERVQRLDGYAEERFYSQLRIGTILYRLEQPWIETKQELLKAYCIDPLRGESIGVIIEHYINMGDWNMAYVYSKFGLTTFHGKSPSNATPPRVLFLDEVLYNWKFLKFHAVVCLHTGRKTEAITTHKELENMVVKFPEMFTQEDMMSINQNSQFFR